MRVALPRRGAFRRFIWLVTPLTLLSASLAHAQTTTNYYYDALGRLIGAYPGSGAAESYSYDAAGNRTVLAHPTTLTPPTTAGKLTAGQTLAQGQSLTSSDGRFTVVMQYDSNLVVYLGGTALWTSGTVDRQAAYLVMLGNGNLVVYGPQGNVLWTSGTGGNSGAWATIQTDGNFVVYSASNTQLWASNTGGH
jgi:hypothetical protein